MAENGVDWTRLESGDRAKKKVALLAGDLIGQFLLDACMHGHDSRTHVTVRVHAGRHAGMHTRARPHTHTQQRTRARVRMHAFADAHACAGAHAHMRI